MASTTNLLEDCFSGKTENGLIERLKVEDEKLAELVRNWCNAVRDQLDIMSSENFRQYTGHGAEHSDAMLACLNWLIPADVIGKMNALELALLVLAVYHHDIGMAFDMRRKTVLEKDRDWLNSKEVLMEKFRRSQTVYDKSDAVMEKLAFVEWTRGRHSQESARWIENERIGRSDYSLGPSYASYPIWEDVKELCRIHTEPSCDDLETARCGPGLSGILINMCFLGCALKMADACHITVDRADEQMEKFIRFTDEFSRLKWKERQCVISVGPDLEHGLLVIRAKPPSADFHRAVVSMGREIKDELEKANMTLSRKKSPLRFPWSNVDYESQVETGPGYEYRDWEYNLNRSRVFDLLMGRNLYADNSVCVRELLQNAVDAVWARWGSIAPTTGKITCRRYLKNKDGQEYEVLEVEDNGIGMDESIIENNLLRVPGESFYRTTRFYCEHPDAAKVMIPIAEHGIGFLSNFMVAKTVEIFTQYDSPKQRAEPIHAELTSLDKGVVYRATPLADFPVGVRQEMGTVVRLWLIDRVSDWHRSSKLGSAHDPWKTLRGIVNHWARSIRIPLSIEEEGNVFSHSTDFSVTRDTILIHDDAAGIHGYVDMDLHQKPSKIRDIQVTVHGFYVRKHPLTKVKLGLHFADGKIDFYGKKDFNLTVDRNGLAQTENSKTLARARSLLAEAAITWIKRQTTWDSSTCHMLKQLLHNSNALYEHDELRKSVIELPIFRAFGASEDQSIVDILQKDTYFFIPIVPIFRADLMNVSVVRHFCEWFDKKIWNLRSKNRLLIAGYKGELWARGDYVVFPSRSKRHQKYPLHLLEGLCDAELEFKEGWPLLKLSPRSDAGLTRGWSKLLNYEPRSSDWLICSTDADACFVNPFCTWKRDIMGNEGRIVSINIERFSQGRKVTCWPFYGFLHPNDWVKIRYEESNGMFSSVEKQIQDLLAISDNIVCPVDRIDYWIRKFVAEEWPRDHEIGRLMEFFSLDPSSFQW
jgi:hypothetical protein